MGNPSAPKDTELNEELNKIFEKVTRLEVIGIVRELVKHNIVVEVSLQDDGKTLKIFYGETTNE